MVGKELLESSNTSTTRDNNNNNNNKEVWGRAGRRHSVANTTAGTNDFVPLTDIEDQATTVYSTQEPRDGNLEAAQDGGGDDGRHKHKGINVTTEISWAVTAREPG